MAEDDDPAPVSYEDLAILEDEFDEVDSQILRTQHTLQKPLYAKRATTISAIPNFWPLVLEQAPPEIDQYIQPEDSRIFGESLESISVSRPELESSESNNKGNARSLRISFIFKPNPDFSDRELSKDFHYRRAKDGWTGLVSEPVRIAWKEGRDVTRGLTGLAADLFAARQKKGDMRSTSVPEYAKLKREVESWNARNTSFFTWFGWVSDRRWVSAEESEAADKAFQEVRERRRKGEKNDGLGVDGGEEGDEEEGDDAEVEVMDDGEDLAVTIAEELWPNAIKYFTQAQEAEELSELDFEEMDEEDGIEEVVDVRELVQGKGKGGASEGPPSKKQKK